MHEKDERTRLALVTIGGMLFRARSKINQEFDRLERQLVLLIEDVNGEREHERERKRRKRR